MARTCRARPNPGAKADVRVRDRAEKTEATKPRRDVMTSMSTIDASTLGISSSQIVGSSTSESDSNTLDADDFLYLFLTQLENQNCLEPMDTSQITDQLCSYSMLEQQISTNEYLASLTQYQASLNSAQALGTIGNTVLMEGKAVSYSGEGETELSFELDADAETATIEIVDETGQVVRTLEYEGLSSGLRSAAWDGLDENGDPASAGEYTFEVTATDAEGEGISCTTYASYLIRAVEFGDGEVRLLTENGERISYGDVDLVTGA